MSSAAPVTAGDNGAPSTKVKGFMLVARALKRQGVDTAFFLMGGPMLDVEGSCITEGIRMIDVRHEQAAAMMAQAYARLLAKPGVCIACSGPGTINLTTGIANALVDCVPVVALGGSSPLAQYTRGAFQEIDQLEIMRPVTKWAERVYQAKRIPYYIDLAFRQATSGRPGPVYLDFPGDMLYEDVEESEIVWPLEPAEREVAPPAASAETVAHLTTMLQEASRPVIVSGSGVLWSKASGELQKFVEGAGIPFYTTPQGRGVVPEDHEYFYGSARSTAMKEADLVLILGTRLNYVIGHGRPPRFSKTAKFVRIDIDPEEINASQFINLGVIADLKTALGQLNASIAGKGLVAKYAPWRTKLGTIEAEKKPAEEARMSTDAMPIHPLRLCKEIRDFVDRDAVMVVDGQEILNFGRQSIPSFVPGHRLNSGTFGTMGVGMPFGVGAKAAVPDKQVVILHGDGSFGFNAMELDTAVRHNLPVLVVISLNGGWTADPEGKKAGSRLGYTRFDKMAEALGCHGEFVERPEDIRPALERAGKAVKEGKCALVNVVTDAAAGAVTVRFSQYMT